MKKIYLFLIITVFFSRQMSSQNIHFYAGLSFSYMSISYIDIPEFYDSFPIANPNIGILFESKISKQLSLMPGIFVNKQGIKMVSEAVSGAYTESKYKISYIEMPLLLSYKFKRTSKNAMYMSLSAGPFYSYGYYGLFSMKDGAVYDEENIFVGSDDLYRSNFGATVMFNAGNENHQLSAYISPGLRNIGMTEGIFENAGTLCAGLSYVFILNLNPKQNKFLLKKILY